MTELKAAVFWLANNLETDARRTSTLHRARPRHEPTLAGTVVSWENGQLVLLVGPVTSLGSLMASLEIRHGSCFRLLNDRPLVKTSRFGIPYGPARLLKSELCWIQDGLEESSIEGPELEAFLTWAAFRQAEMTLASQGEIGWGTAQPFPFVRRKGSIGASIADLM